MKNKILPLTVFFTLCMLMNTSAQWKSLGKDIIPNGYRVYAQKIAPDKSIWVVSTFDSSDLSGRSPIVHRLSEDDDEWVPEGVTLAAGSGGLDIAPIDKMTAYMATNRSGLLKTTDGNQTWEKVETYPYRPYQVHFFNENEGWILGRGDTYRIIMSVTNDGGETWIHSGYEVGVAEGMEIPQDTLSFSGFTYSMSSTYDVHDNTIVVTRSNGNYWRSDDKGYTWTNNISPLTNFGLTTNHIAIQDEHTIMLVGSNRQEDLEEVSAISSTTRDGGETWEYAGMPMVTSAALKHIPNTDGTFIMVGHFDFGTGDRGTSITYDYGNTWEIIDDTRLLALHFLDEKTGIGSCCNNIWDTTDGQIFRWNLDLSTSTVENLGPEAINIMPNPTSHNLKIQVGNAFDGESIRLEVYTVEGKLMIEREQASAPEIDLMVSSLPNGIYSLRISDDEKLVIKKFIKI